MGNSTRWENDYARTTQECIDAREKVAAEPSPRVWPASGTATTWNPGGDPKGVLHGVKPRRIYRKK